MAPEHRKRVSEPTELAALTHPLRLDLITYLMANGPATASDCARAVGDTPSNCSYHLRVLQDSGLVAAAESPDGRERPWRATLTGFAAEPDKDASAQALTALMVQRDYRLTREYLARRGEAGAEWQAADGHATYTLRMTPDELAELGERLDALIRPYLAATRDAAPGGSALVHLGLHAFPLLERN